MDKLSTLCKNRVQAWLGKSPSEFTRDDIVRFVTANDIRMINFMYPAADGRLKTLNFVVNNLAYLENILTLGERVDGSSLFPFIDTDIPTLTMLCSFFDKDGHHLESAPE